MKSISIHSITIVLLLVTYVSNNASTSIPIPLEKRIVDSSHIVVGVLREVKVVDAQLQEVKPTPELLAQGQRFHLIIEVQESLYPEKWQSKVPIKVLFGDAFQSTTGWMEGWGNKPFIYLLRQQEKGELLYFVSTAGCYPENIDIKAKVQQIIEEMQKNR